MARRSPLDDTGGQGVPVNDGQPETSLIQAILTTFESRLGRRLERVEDKVGELGKVVNSQDSKLHKIDLALVALRTNAERDKEERLRELGRRGNGNGSQAAGSKPEKLDTVGRVVTALPWAVALGLVLLSVLLLLGADGSRQLIGGIFGP